VILAEDKVPSPSRVDETERSAWKCGRRRQDGSRCRRTLAYITATPEGDWRIRIEGDVVFLEEEGPRRLNVSVRPTASGVAFFGPGDRWEMDCHPRCGAHYTFTDTHVRELAARGDLYLADAVQAFQTTEIRSGSNL
jgi:hypothetical protein